MINLKKHYFKIINEFRKPILVEDEFIEWLNHITPGIHSPGNTYLMDYAVQHLPDDSPVIEIGSFCGLSTNIISYLLRKHNKTNVFYTCDKWEFENETKGGIIGNSGFTQREYELFARETFLRNVNKFSGKNLPFTVELFADEFFQRWGNRTIVEDVFERTIQLGGPISFCFIDGNHKYPFVKSDFDNCDKYLVPGGFILFDDSADSWGIAGVQEVVREISKSKKYKTVFKNPNYLIQKL